MKYTEMADVTADYIADFLTYLIFQKGFNKWQIVEVVSSPHKYKKEYSDFTDMMDKKKELENDMNIESQVDGYVQNLIDKARGK